MKTTVEITLKSLSLSGIPEKALLISRNLLTVEMIWPKAGTPRKSATRQITAKAALKEGADMIDAALVSYGDIAAAPVDALATMVAEKDAPRIIVQGVLDYDDLPAAGETKEVVVPLTRPKFSKTIGSLTLVVKG